MNKLLSTLIATISLSVYASLFASTPSWTEASNTVCTQLQSASTAYNQGKLTEARNTAVMAYFQNYDLVIEPTARLYFPESHIFQIEQLFNQLNTAFVSPSDEASEVKVKTLVDTLCQQLQQDGTILDKKHLSQQPQ